MDFEHLGSDRVICFGTFSLLSQLENNKIENKIVNI